MNDLHERICILGSTGSIGTQALEVIEDLGTIEVVGLSAYQNIDLLEKQIHQFHPQKVAVMDEQKAYELKKRIGALGVEVLSGIEGFIQVATMPQCDLVLTSVVGIVGLLPTLAAIHAHKDIALANKETLVTAGELVMKEAKSHGVTIYPVDSEHSAIFQCLQGNQHNSFNRIILTASGGPFRGKTISDLENVTVEDALRHPNWTMGKKITIDSATMMNKGLEVIEAKWLFDTEVDKIEVLVHPQSIIHSMVEFEDGSVMAQMGEPDMKLPIQYAFTYPKRVKGNCPKIDFMKRSQLSFELPDMKTFGCLRLAYKAINIGGTMPAVLNGANEAAVEFFLQKKIHFLDIPILLEKAMDLHRTINEYTISDVLKADQWARQFVWEQVEKISRK